MSYSALFLVFAAAGVLHVSEGKLILIVTGYYLFAQLDQWLAWKENKHEIQAKKMAIEEELYGWETDPEDPEVEIQGHYGRVKLTGKDQAIVTRIAMLLLSNLAPRRRGKVEHLSFF